MERGDDRLLDLRAAEGRGLLREGNDGILVEDTPVRREVRPEQILSRLVAGKVDEEDLVEAPLAQELRRHRRDVVRRGHDEDRRAMLLQPRQERSEQPLADAAV